MHANFAKNDDDKGSSTAGGKALSSFVFNTMNERCPYDPKGCQIEIQLPTEHCQRSTKLVISTGSTVVLNKSTISWTKLKNFKKMLTLVKQSGKETVI